MWGIDFAICHISFVTLLAKSINILQQLCTYYFWSNMIDSMYCWGCFFYGYTLSLSPVWLSTVKENKEGNLISSPHYILVDCATTCMHIPLIGIYIFHSRFVYRTREILLASSNHRTSISGRPPNFQFKIKLLF